MVLVMGSQLTWSLLEVSVNSQSLRNKNEELRGLQLQGYNPIGIRKMWWDSSQNCSVIMDTYRLFRDETLGR